MHWCTVHFCIFNCRYLEQQEPSISYVRVSESSCSIFQEADVMEATAVDPGVPRDSAVDAGAIMAALHQPENIETLVVAGDFIELGSSYEIPGETAVSVGNDETQVFEVVHVEPDGGAAANSKMEVSEVLHEFKHVVLL